jgi:hypothetical protein
MYVRSGEARQKMLDIKLKETRQASRQREVRSCNGCQLSAYTPHVFMIVFAPIRIKLFMDRVLELSIFSFFHSVLTHLLLFRIILYVFRKLN